MQLIRLTIQTPIRNEEQIISGWEDHPELFNPSLIQSVGYKKEIGKAVITTPGGQRLPVAESIEIISQMFEDATV